MLSLPWKSGRCVNIEPLFSHWLEPRSSSTANTSAPLGWASATPVVALHADYLVIYSTDLGPLGTLGNPSILISLLHLHPPSVLLVKNNLQSSREGAVLSSVWAFVCSSSSSWDAFPHFLLLADSEPSRLSVVTVCEKLALTPLRLCLVRCPSTALCTSVTARGTLCGNCWVTCLSPP